MRRPHAVKIAPPALKLLLNDFDRHIAEDVAAIDAVQREIDRYGERWAAQQIFVSRKQNGEYRKQIEEYERKIENLRRRLAAFERDQTDTRRPL